MRSVLFASIIASVAAQSFTTTTRATASPSDDESGLQVPTKAIVSDIQEMFPQLSTSTIAASQVCYHETFEKLQLTTTDFQNHP
jgi:hypothetical protein